MSLADRVARLEAKFARAMPMPTPETVPVMAITLRAEQDDGSPFRIEHDGRQWEQRAGETVRDLHARARAEAMEAFASDEEDPALILVARQRSSMPVLREKTSGRAAQTGFEKRGD